jgi:hypothetical protein
MSGKSSDWFNVLVSKWETRASLLQFVAEDVWELPYVKSTVATLTAILTGALTLPDETYRYAVAVLAGVAMYAMLWFRLNLRPIMERAAATAQQAVFAAPEEDEATQERKRNLARFIREDFTPAIKALAGLMEESVNAGIGSNETKRYEILRLRSAHEKHLREIDRETSERYVNEMRIGNVQIHAEALLNWYNEQLMTTTQELKNCNYGFDTDRYLTWISDDRSMLRKIHKLISDGGYPRLSRELGEKWGMEERRLCPKYPHNDL